MKKLKRLISQLSTTLLSSPFLRPLPKQSFPDILASGTPPPGTSLRRDHSLSQEKIQTDRSTDLSVAIQRASSYVLGMQDPGQGYWADELEADSTLTSEYIMLRYFLGKVDRQKQAKAVHYLRDRQLPDGGWAIYYGGPSEISASIKAYFALKLTGISPAEPFMKKARELILAKGGVLKANVFTKIALALFGQFDWRGIPTMPTEIIFLPNWFYFNLYEVSYWSRAVIAPLLIIFVFKPLCRIPTELGIEELYGEPRHQIKKYFKKDPQWFTWKNFFLTIDQILKVYDRLIPTVLRRRAIKKAADWMIAHMRGEGGLGAIYPAMANSAVALTCLGHGPDHPALSKALREIENLEIEDETSLHLQPCVSPIWDTCLTVNALIEAGFSGDHPVLVKASHWMLSKQIKTEGDWKVKAPHAEPGGWYFQFENEFYPDVDDTAVVLMGLAKVHLPDEEAKLSEMIRSFRWLLALQSHDGGWGAFDRDNCRLILNNIPFADHGALLDPSTCDVTGRCLEAMGFLGYDKSYPPAASAIRFIKAQQETEGCWYGRWGVNYIYGTWSVLAGLRAIGEDLQQDYIQRPVDWLKKVQNPDGGWGESCQSYADPKMKGLGKSTPSQTAWALMALFNANLLGDPVVDRGIGFLLKTQKGDGSWEEAEFTGTGFPRVFYLRYHMYCKYFPLWALSMYRSMKQNGKTRADLIRLKNRQSQYYRFFAESHRGKN
jgi:squalene-hopene/tetraprenyl-beta-curcumene cyclase